MTRIVYDRQSMSIAMEGHALSAEYGKDLICAAESMLIMCLEKRLRDFGESVMLTVSKSPGRVYIEARPGEEAETRCRACFDTIYAGFVLLAEYEPEHVQAREIWGEEKDE